MIYITTFDQEPNLHKNLQLPNLLDLIEEQKKLPHLLQHKHHWQMQHNLYLYFFPTW